ncbi:MULTISPECIES: hypothetical protein [unclassified Burkholderia]|uniref:hypothetical protein n=1 Tax=unclassified Burkholderia TaxID=2613784 RepID=UPI000F56BA86|nr:MULTISPECIES: hypothetical protein [unclassified Burkholderia]
MTRWFIGSFPVGTAEERNEGRRPRSVRRYAAGILSEKYPNEIAQKIPPSMPAAMPRRATGIATARSGRNEWA